MFLHKTGQHLDEILTDFIHVIRYQIHILCVAVTHSYWAVYE